VPLRPLTHAVTPVRENRSPSDQSGARSSRSDGACPRNPHGGQDGFRVSAGRGGFERGGWQRPPGRFDTPFGVDRESVGTAARRRACRRQSSACACHRPASASRCVACDGRPRSSTRTGSWSTASSRAAPRSRAASASASRAGLRAERRRRRARCARALRRAAQAAHARGGGRSTPTRRGSSPGSWAGRVRGAGHRHFFPCGDGSDARARARRTRP
jgi:hypothetical protein